MIANAERIAKFLAENKPRKGSRNTEVKSNVTDNESAKMQTSNGAIQGYNAITAADNKHQIITYTQTIGSGPEYHTLQPMIEGLRSTLAELGEKEDVIADVLYLADTGYATEDNMKYIFENEINAVVPDKNFRQRDPKFDEYERYKPKERQPKYFANTDFCFDAETKTCICPAGKKMWQRGENVRIGNNLSIVFQGYLKDCRECPLRKRCMQKPPKKNGRQVSFVIDRETIPNFTNLMKAIIDSEEGKEIYSERMGIIEPVFGNITENKRLDRFTLRGTEKVNTQWKLYCLVHNIEKLHYYGDMDLG